MSHIMLVIGGARSGKSAYAEQLAMRLPQPVLYMASATAQDDEMIRRVEKHRQRRPISWKTLELGANDPTPALRNEEGFNTILFDCLSLYVSRYLWENHATMTYEAMEESLMAESDSLIKELKGRNLSLIVVSSEVGQGLVPENQLSRDYRDLLGSLNQFWAKKSESVYFVSAGIPLKLK